MISIKTKLQTKEWANSAATQATVFNINGQVYLDQEPAEIDILATQFSNAQSLEQLTKLLNRLNGFYCWVEQSNGQLRAGVDHIRSRPLFYAVSHGQFYLSDDAEWVRQQVGDIEMTPLARDEFQLTGYVTGSDTLFPKIKQLQAGEYLSVCATDSGPVFEKHGYYRFQHQQPAEYHEPELFAALHKVTVSVIQRLIDYASGRQIVIPLSGGYDSRLIATMLKKLGYKNVLTFTYGISGNKESSYSKHVADSLNLRWHFVEYTVEMWREAWRSKSRWLFQEYASGWTSLPHIQDWLALQKLKEAEVVDADAIFVPGHCCVTGFIPNYVFNTRVLSLSEFVSALAEKHYNLSSPEDYGFSRGGRLFEYLKRFGPDEKAFDRHEFVSRFMEYGWRERQAKFIVNSVRAYEFHNFNWWLPLWDKEYSDFWKEFPIELRKSRYWYISYVDHIYESESTANFSKIGNASHSYLRTLMRSLLPDAVKYYIKFILSKVGFTNQLSPLGWEGCLESNEISKYFSQKKSINSFLAVDFIKNSRLF